MGCDGGSIPGRSDLVKVRKKEGRGAGGDLDAAKALARSRWQLCALSKERLRPPVVADALGQLFNKEALLTALLRKTLPPPFRHISRCKDVVELKLTANPAYRDIAFVAESGEEVEVPFMCPITSLPANGMHSFVALRGCGCVFSQRALREVPSNECLQCRHPYGPQDVLPLNGSVEQIEALRQYLPSRDKGHSSSRKRKARKEGQPEGDNDLKTGKKSRRAAKEEAKGRDSERGKDVPAEKKKEKAQEDDNPRKNGRAKGMGKSKDEAATKERKSGVPRPRPREDAADHKARNPPPKRDLFISSAERKAPSLTSSRA